MDNRERLRQRIGLLNDDTVPRPLVSLELFFIDNHDVNSLGETRPRTQSPQVYYEFFKRLRDHEHVADILVEVTGLGPPGGWPTAHTVWIITSLSRFPDLPRALPTEFDGVLPDDWLTYPRLDGISMEQIQLPTGMRAQGFYYY